MGKNPSFLDDVLEHAAGNRPGFRGWFECLSADAQREMQVAWDRFDPAVHQWRPYAVAVMKAAKARGWNTSGVQGVIAWLKRGR